MHVIVTALQHLRNVMHLVGTVGVAECERLRAAQAAAGATSLNEVRALEADPPLPIAGHDTPPGRCTGCGHLFSDHAGPPPHACLRLCPCMEERAR